MPKIPEVSVAVIESRKTFRVGHLTVRIWREERGIAASYNNDDVVEICRTIGLWNDRVDLIKLLIALPRMSAVEIMKMDEGEGDGLVLYKEWP